MVKQNRSYVRYRCEYLKHLKKNTYPILLLMIVFMIISAAVTLCAAAIINPLTKNIASIKKCRYDYAVESQNKSSDYRQNYKLENLVTFLNSNKRINVNTYISSDIDNGIISFNDSLKADEIAISRRIADRLGVHEGDSLQVLLSIYDTPVVYYVKEIFPYVSDYYKIEDNQDFAVAFLGYNKKIESHIRGKYVFFLTESEFEQFSHTSLDYEQRYYVRGELEELTHKVERYSIGFVFGIFAIALIYHMFILKLIKCEVIKYSKDCFSLNVIKMFYNADHMFYSGFPLILLCLLSFKLKLPLYFEVGYICISITCIIWWLIGGKCFEKAT